MSYTRDDVICDDVICDDVICDDVIYDDVNASDMIDVIADKMAFFV